MTPFEWTPRKPDHDYPESYSAKAGRLVLVAAHSSVDDGWSWWIEGAHEVELGHAPSRGLAMVAAEAAFRQLSDTGLRRGD